MSKIKWWSTLTCLRALALAVAALTSLAVSNQARALSSYDFLITYDGTTATVDAASDPIAGTSLVPGDIFKIDVHATPNDFWQVTLSDTLGLFATFFVLDSGIRVSNITTTLLLDGAQVAQSVLLGEAQNSVHIGGQVFGILAGQIFDQLVVDVEFLSTTSSFTTIQTGALNFSPFYMDPSISYVRQPVVSVPEPTTSVTFGAGLLGLLLFRRRSA